MQSGDCITASNMRCSKQEKALCILADQSQMQRATNHHREAGAVIVPPPVQKIKEEKQNEFLIYKKFRDETA